MTVAANDDDDSLASLEDAVLPLVRPRARPANLVSRVCVGLSIAVMSALLLQTFMPQLAQAEEFAGDARSYVTRAGERVSQAARELWRHPND